MVETTMSKVGNSMGVLLPKALRAAASFELGEPLRLDSPRKGVVVITAVVDEENDRLLHLESAEARIRGRYGSVRPWPEGKTADDLLRSGKDARAHELAPV